MKVFSLAVIGAGQAGLAAIRAANRQGVRPPGAGGRRLARRLLAALLRQPDLVLPRSFLLSPGTRDARRPRPLPAPRRGGGLPA